MEIIAQIIALIIALTLHEFAHAYVSHLLGDTTAEREGRLSLNPVAHIDPFATLLLPAFLILVHSPVIFGAAKPVPFNPWALRWGRLGAALVALAGPGMNFLLAIIASLWLHFIPTNVTSGTILVAIIAVNVGLGVFNLIPFPPLDGSRLLYAIAPPSLRDVMDNLERVGLIGIALFLFVFYPFVSPFISMITRAIMAVLVPSAGLP